MWLVSPAPARQASMLPKLAEPSGRFHRAPALASDVAKLQAASGGIQYRPTTASFCQLPTARINSVHGNLSSRFQSIHDPLEKQDKSIQTELFVASVFILPSSSIKTSPQRKRKQRSLTINQHDSHRCFLPNCNHFLYCSFSRNFQ